MSRKFANQGARYRVQRTAGAIIAYSRVTLTPATGCKLWSKRRGEFIHARRCIKSSTRNLRLIDSTRVESARRIHASCCKVCFNVVLSSRVLRCCTCVHGVLVVVRPFRFVHYKSCSSAGMIIDHCYAFPASSLSFAKDRQT